MNKTVFIEGHKTTMAIISRRKNYSYLKVDTTPKARRKENEKRSRWRLSRMPPAASGPRSRSRPVLSRLLTFEAKPPEALLNEVQSLLLLERLAL